MVTYKYTCEECGAKAGPFHSELQQTAYRKPSIGGRNAFTLEYNSSDLTKTGNDASNQLQQLTAQIDAMLSGEPTPESPFAADHFSEVFAMGKACPVCECPQTWYSTHPRKFLKKQKKAPINHMPLVEWGEEISVEVTGITLPPEDAGTTASTTSRVIKGVKNPSELGVWHMRGLEHNNILAIIDIIELPDGTLNVIEEDFYGAPMNKLIHLRISERDFQDYVLQLCDALEFMHRQAHPISHNAIRPESMIIGKGSLLKLTNFESATVAGPPHNDIAMVGEFMGSIKQKYIKRYAHIISNCADTYNSINELREDFLPLLQTSYIKIVGAISFALLVLAIIARRIF